MRSLTVRRILTGLCLSTLIAVGGAAEQKQAATTSPGRQGLFSWGFWRSNVPSAGVSHSTAGDNGDLHSHVKERGRQPEIGAAPPGQGSSHLQEVGETYDLGNEEGPADAGSQGEARWATTPVEACDLGSEGTCANVWSSREACAVMASKQNIAGKGCPVNQGAAGKALGNESDGMESGDAQAGAQEGNERHVGQSDSQQPHHADMVDASGGFEGAGEGVSDGEGKGDKTGGGTGENSAGDHGRGQEKEDKETEVVGGATADAKAEGEISSAGAQSGAAGENRTGFGMVGGNPSSPNASDRSGSASDASHGDGAASNATDGGENEEDVHHGLSHLHLHRDQFHHLSQKLSSRTSAYIRQHSTWHIPEFLFGVALSIAGVVYAVTHYRHDIMGTLIKKEPQDETIRALKEMDVETLKDVLGDINLPSWIRFPDFERTGWFNLIIKQLWPYVKASIHAQIHDIVDPLLMQNKPSWMRSIRLTKFDLGEQPPQANGVKVYSDDDISDEIIAEIDFLWAGDQDIELTLQPIPARVPVVAFASRSISHRFFMSVGIEKVIVTGRLRIIFKPLISEMPVIGAVQVALVDKPTFSFDLTVYDQDINALPGLESWLNNMITEYGLGPYMLPNTYTYNLVPEEQLGVDKPDGMLFVQLIEAEHVPRSDVLSAPDPYVTMQVREKGKMTSQTMNNSWNPKWDEDFKFLVHAPHREKLTLTLYDYDMLTVDDVLGVAELAVKDMQASQEMDLWLDIKPPPDEQSNTSTSGKDGDDKGAGVMNKGKRAGTAMVDAAKKAHGKHEKKPRIHIKATYYCFSDDELDSALRDGGRGISRDNPAMNYLMGGVLYVTPKKASQLVHKPLLKGGALKSTATAVVKVCGHKKKSAKAKGSDPVFNETVEFMLGEDEINKNKDQKVEVEIWDYKLFNSFRGRVSMPLKDIIKQKRIKSTFPLDGVTHGDLAVEFRWFGLLDQD